MRYLYERGLIRRNMMPNLVLVSWYHYVHGSRMSNKLGDIRFL